MRRLAFVPLFFAVLLPGSIAMPAVVGAEDGVASSTSATAIGFSVQGRAIDVGCLGEGERTVLVVGGLHTGTESVGAELALELAGLLWGGGIEVPSNVQVCVLPTLNPDGIALDLHTNARGVDLNRNWPASNWTTWAYHPETGPVSGGSAPLSEPETRALYDYIAAIDPALVIVYHCCGSLVEANSVGGASLLGAEYARGAGFSYIDTWQLYAITGQFIDAMDTVGVPAIDVELATTGATGLVQHRAGLSAVLVAVAEQQVVVTAAPEAREAPSDGTHYVVQWGDTLANIAFRFGVNVDALAWANGITNPELIEIGDLLTIP